MALLSIPLGFASLHYEQGQPISLANDLQLFTFRWQSLFRIGWQWTEVALRNRINRILEPHLGIDWLRNSCLSGGIFDNPRTQNTLKIIGKAYNSLVVNAAYTPTKLMAEMEFGIWKYMYSGPQYAATGQKLLSVFPNKPKSTPTLQIDNKYVFNELDHINQLRNRIAHHEPICFEAGLPVKSVSYAQTEYYRILKMLGWMGIDSAGLLYGIDHVTDVCQKILSL